MTGRSSWDIKKVLFSLIILSGLAVSVFSQDKQISGVINVYRRVVAIGPGADNVILNNVDSIAPGDTVLLIQMKGAIIYEPETSFFGSYRESIGVPGSSEFLIVHSVNTGTKSVIFTNDISNGYNVTGMVQLIKVPSYNSVTVQADLTCQPWDSTNKTGGVLAMIVERNLTLDANINVTGKGFAGGATSPGQGICLGTNTVLYDKFSYPVSYTNSGYKGESQAIKVFINASNMPSIFPAYAKGKGNNFTGGGGGNGKFSGGGGGSNYGVGGKGGREIATCTPSPGDGGIGGRQVRFTDLDGRIFPGGGGGSSTYEIGSTSSPGSRGGGIVIILCDTLKGKGKVIKADGATAITSAGLNAGAGGGGGGGSIAIHQQSFSTKLETSALTLSANGGKGGNSNVNFGEGGGGGGGLIVTNNTLIPVNVIKTVTGGTGGTRSGGSTSGTAGLSGQSLTTFIPVLTGFLFNAVRSSVTGNQVDSVCSDMLPPKIRGTNPVGGTAPYIYAWEKSYDQNTWIPLVNDADPVNYTPVMKETATVYFRRTVTDSSVPVNLIDICKPVMIFIQPNIKNNIIGDSNTLCVKGDPLLLKQLLPDLIVPSAKNIFFNWQDSSATGSWGLTKAISKNYDPPAGLEKTTWYRRTVSSGRCVDSTAIVKITVLVAINNNSILNSPADICYGMKFTDLSATNVPSMTGGDNTYKFKWESNINSAGWVTAPGVSNMAGYNPVELPQRLPLNEYYFRRIVYSGNNDVCKDTSASVHLKDFPAISNNTISANQIIGHDSIPDPLIGLQPGNGDGTYSYLWLSKTKIKPWDTAPPVNNGNSYYPASLTDTTWYRRAVISSVCKDSSNIVVVNVHKAITNNTISFVSGAVEDTICYGSVSGLLKGTVPAGGSRITGINNPGDYAYKWYRSTDGNTWNEIVGSTGQNYQPVALLQTTFFRREVVSPAVTPSSVSITNIIIITVLPPVSNKIAGSDSICYNTQPALLQGVNLSGGDNIYIFTWQDSTNVAGWKNIPGGTTSTHQPPNLTLSAKYRRIVYSGSNNCCIKTSNSISIGIRQLPTGTIIHIPDTTICEGSKVRLKIHLTGKTRWEVTYKENLTNGPVFKIAAADTTLLVRPVPGAANTTFNYSLASVRDKYGCIAASLTGVRKAVVYKLPNANAGRDTVICGAIYELNATPSFGTGTWYFPTAVIASTANKPTVKITIDSTYTGKNVAHKFYWEEINWQCRKKDSVLITFDKRVSSINAGPDTTIYSFDNIIHMVADHVQSWETGNWSVVSGKGDFNNSSNNLAVVMNLSEGKSTFLWKVTNSKCKLEDIVNVDVHKEFIPRAFSPNNDGFNNTFIITGLDLINQIAELKIVNGAGKEVFLTSNLDRQIWTDWDGKNSKGFDLPEGTYYYLLKVTSKGNGHVFKRSGFIVLKRY
ncbi:MAG: gliding motility-associated C-terminal domain-containing protein [Bacteroidota bacterium]